MYESAEELKAEKVQKKEAMEENLSPEEKIGKLEGDIALKEADKSYVSSSVDQTQKKYTALRENMGLPSSAEEPPSILSDKQRLEQLEKEVETLKIERGAIESGQKGDAKKDINVGDEVYYEGRIWHVHTIGERPRMKQETDWEADPFGKKTKEVKDVGGIVSLVDTKGNVQEGRGVGWDAIEKVTPENRAKIEKMIKENKLS